MEANDLPPINRFVADEILKMIIEDTGCRRPPEKAAELLALIYELNKTNTPFPTREVAAQAIGASVSTVDAALSTRLDEGYIKLKVETPSGSVNRRSSVVRERHYIPCPELIEIAKKAEKRSRR